MRPRGVAVQQVIPVNVLGLPLVASLTLGLPALGTPEFPVANLFRDLMLVQLLVLWEAFRVVLEEILVVEGRVQCACQVYMLLVLKVGELSPLHFAGEAVEDVDVQVVHTQRRFEREARL